ncbi:hypothetical protein [Clostridium sp. Marseille-Q7071]
MAADTDPMDTEVETASADRFAQKAKEYENTDVNDFDYLQSL